MQLAWTVAIQVLIIFILISIGYILTKLKYISNVGIKQMTDILLMIVTPCVLIEAYQKKFELSLAKGLLYAAVFTVIIHILGVIVCKILFRKEESNRYRVSRFAGICSNCGFMAIPLLSAALGNDGVFYGSAYLMVFTVFYWTYGVYICTEDKKKLFSLKQAFINPGVIGVVIGLVLFVTGTKLPYVISKSVSYMASLNTPVAMIILGAFLVKVNFKKALTNASLYLVCLARLIIIPLLGIGIIKLIGIDSMVAKTVMIGASCPVATVTSLFAERYGLDTTYASEVVSLSTLMSVVTIPFMMIICSYCI